VSLLAAVVLGVTACSPSPADEPSGAAADESQPADASPTLPTEGEGAQAPDEAPTVPPLHPSVDGYPETVVTIERADAEPLTVPVKLAATPEQRRHGLMEVPELPPGTGMLFTFEDDRIGRFWMKDTLVPLDIAFVDADDTIVAILAMDPCEEDPCEVYEPGVAYRAALEVPQGWFAAEGVAVGDRLSAPAGGEG
jgi:uncharacterized protein